MALFDRDPGARTAVGSIISSGTRIAGQAPLGGERQSVAGADRMDNSVRSYVSAAAPDDNRAALDDRRHRARSPASAAREFPPSVKRIGLRRRWKRGDLDRGLRVFVRI